MAEPVDLQAKLDALLADNPEIQKYVTKLWYVADGAVIPVDVTHTLELQSMTSDDRSLTVGAVVKPEYAVVLDALLAMIATNPTGSV